MSGLQESRTKDDDQLKGAASKVAGKVETAADRLLDDGVQAQDQARQLQGQVQAAAGAAHDTSTKAADTAHDAVSTVADRAGQAYGRAARAFASVRDRVDPFIEEKPYAALGMAAGVGLVVGLLLAGGGSRTVYVRSRT